jgi:hypothetical protein
MPKPDYQRRGDGSRRLTMWLSGLGFASCAGSRLRLRSVRPVVGLGSIASIAALRVSRSLRCRARLG